MDTAVRMSPNRNGSLLRHTVIYGGASFFAYLLSMLKAVVMGRLFGTTPEMDAYTVAILLPNLIGGLISSTSAGALVPILAKAELESEKARATVFRSSLAVFSAVSFLLALLFAFFASPIAHLVGAAFDQYRLQLTVRMLRWASALVFSTGVYAVCSAELLARKRYWVVGISPAVGTAISLAMILSFSKAGIDVLVWSLVAGTAVQAAILVVPCWSGSREGSLVDWGNKHVKQNLAAQVTLLGAAGIGVFNIFIDQMFATRLPSGSASALTYASALHNLMMQAVVMALSWVALPELSALAGAGKFSELRARVRQVVILAAMLAAPASIGVLAFGHEAIHLIFEHGRFHAESTRAVFSTWAAYSFGLVPAAAGMIIVRLINAIGKNSLLFRIGIGLLLVNATLDYVFMHVWGLVGISLSTSLVYFISAIVLFTVIHAHIGMIFDRRTTLLVCATIAGALMAIAPTLILRVLIGNTVSTTVVGLGLFMVLMVAAYACTPLLHFTWYGFGGMRRMPFHLALEKI